METAKLKLTAEQYERIILNLSVQLSDAQQETRGLKAAIEELHSTKMRILTLWRPVAKAVRPHVPEGGNTVVTALALIDAGVKLNEVS